MKFFFVKQKTAYEMRISDWSSDVCSSDLEQESYNGNEQRHLSRRQHTRPGEPRLVIFGVKERRGSTYNGNGDDESHGERAGETARHRLQHDLRFPDPPTGNQQRLNKKGSTSRMEREGQ